MIISFGDGLTAELYQSGRCLELPTEIWKRGRRRLDQLNQASCLEDMAFPRSSRLEKLHGLNPPRYSIRVNGQYRITFEWQDGHAASVLIEDYHR